MTALLHQLWETVRHWPWAQLWETVRRWPWANIAAFSAAFAALRVAQTESRERQLLLRRQAVVDLIQRGSEWSTQAGQLLLTVWKFIEDRSKFDSVMTEVVELTGAIVTVRAAAHTIDLTCSDADLSMYGDEMTAAMKRFVDLFAPPEDADPKERREILERALADCETVNETFSAAVAAAHVLGNHLYRPRAWWNVRARWRRRTARLDHRKNIMSARAAESRNQTTANVVAPATE